MQDFSQNKAPLVFVAGSAAHNDLQRVYCGSVHGNGTEEASQRDAGRAEEALRGKYLRVANASTHVTTVLLSAYSTICPTSRITESSLLSISFLDVFPADGCLFEGIKLNYAGLKRNFNETIYVYVISQYFEWGKTAKQF